MSVGSVSEFGITSAKQRESPNRAERMVGEDGGAHLASTRMNIGPIILKNQIEELMEILNTRCLPSLDQ